MPGGAQQGFIDDRGRHGGQGSGAQYVLTRRRDHGGCIGRGRAGVARQGLDLLHLHLKSC
jgi:hypothetical protein